ncbi:acylneuraminate cytidylyltransferase family protein [Lacrimispora sp.]|uniref:acylneuraminate cytidylyltransferase family protein n=1 Tax=Lacrimispora sp. TaxID=2719234 RepID=UPI0028A8F1FA|nr:acylneuraminate cytidylyltransferase family protein [Lacrimispora sp.]
MKIACFIPIKSNSERVPGKNFRILNGKKLYEYIILHAMEAQCFDDIYVDTNSEEVKEYANGLGVKVINRDSKLAESTANGNDLLVYHQEIHPEYDYYFQLFATAPYLQSRSIRNCANFMLNSEEFDSCFTAVSNHNFYWFNNMPVNYRPDILPRSQDMVPVMEETTGMYGISSESLKKYKSRIGRKPYIYCVNKFEAVDINTEDDLKMASYVGKVYWNYSFEE